MAVPFYNQVDQDIYAGGEHFIPQQQYRLNYTPSQSLASTIGNTGGVTGAQAAVPYIWPPQGGGGGGGNSNIYGYDPTDSKQFDTVDKMANYFITDDIMSQHGHKLLVLEKRFKETDPEKLKELLVMLKTQRMCGI